jgi:hypothetical protein
VSATASAALGIFGSLIMLSVPLYFVLQAWLPLRWSGGWRVAALLPLIPIGPAIAWSLYALSDHSNLWPITVVLLAPPCFLYLLILCALHRGGRRLSQPRGGGGAGGPV